MVFLRYGFPHPRDHLGDLVPKWGKCFRLRSASVNVDAHNHESDTPYGCPGWNRGDWNAWGRFAHTMNGYEVQGGFKPCADLANAGEAKTLTELRFALFFEARRERHSSDMSTDQSLIRELLGAIR